MNEPRQPLFRWSRVVFALYAVALFAATHWPKLALPLGPLPRPDLLQHLVAFGGWAALFTTCGFFGRWSSARNIWISGFIGVLYACLDESLQAIPAIKRVFGLDDMALNVLGIAVGTAVVAVLAKRFSPRRHSPRRASSDMEG